MRTIHHNVSNQSMEDVTFSMVEIFWKEIDESSILILMYSASTKLAGLVDYSLTNSHTLWNSVLRISTTAH